MHMRSLFTGKVLQDTLADWRATVECRGVGSVIMKHMMTSSNVIHIADCLPS